MKKRGRNIIVAVTGASGTIYARQLIDRLSASPEVAKVGLIVSEKGE
jgi:3-polyprenyl-4-hydroxybenzoate decarboxylase